MLMYITSMESQQQEQQDCKQKGASFFFFLKKLKRQIKREIIIGNRKYP